MPQFISPGVYILERDFSDYIASLQSTSLALVSTAKRGPLNTPTLITTPDQFLDVFGEPTVNQYGPHAALNYLRRGNQLWYVRIAKEYERGVTTLISMGAVTSTGRVYSIEVAPNHGLVVGDYVRIVQTGKATSQNLEITAVDTNVLTFGSSLFDAYDASSDSDCRVDYSDGSQAAAHAEVFGFSRHHGEVFPILKFTARYPGDFANFGTRQGIEVIIEDGGQFANVDSNTGNPVESDEGIPLQGVSTAAPSVDTKYDLLALTSTDGVRVGQTRGVNFDSAIGRISVVADSGGDLLLTVDNTTGFNVDDSITITGTDTYDGTYTVGDVPSSTLILVSGFTGVITAGAVTGFVEDQDYHQFGTVYRCTAISTTASTWVPQGVLTKRVRIFYQGRQVEVFDNIVGYDPNSSNFWDTVIGSISGTPVSKFVYCEYFGEDGEAPICSHNRIKHPNNPRLTMGTSTAVRILDTSNSATQTFENARGFNGENPSSSDYIGTIDEDGAYSGLQHFRRTDLYDISLMACPGVSLAAVLQEMISILDERNDCLGVFDPPFGLTAQQVVDWHNGMGSYTGLHSAFVTNRAALYWTWVKQYDPYTKRELWLPPTCVVPGIMAYNDFSAEVWYAPAGIIRGKVPNALNLEHVVSRGEMDYMYGPGNGNAVNAITKFAKDGIVVYGQRTLQRHPSALDRVNVRRLLFMIEKSVAAATRRLVFEQNDPILWEQFTNLVEPFLRSLQGRRALEWFHIKCDETTNTPDRRNNNEMYAKIYLIPVKSAEKIILDFTLLASGANVSEFITQDIQGSTVNA